MVPLFPAYHLGSSPSPLVGIPYLLRFHFSEPICITLYTLRTRSPNSFQISPTRPYDSFDLSSSSLRGGHSYPSYKLPSPLGLWWHKWEMPLVGSNNWMFGPQFREVEMVQSGWSKCRIKSLIITFRKFATLCLKFSMWVSFSDIVTFHSFLMW